MRQPLLLLLVLGLGSGIARGDTPAEKSSGKDTSLQALKKEYDQAAKSYQDDQNKRVQEARQALQKAKTQDERQKIIDDFMAARAKDPRQAFSGRFLAFAEKHADEQEGFDALMLALQSSGGPYRKDSPWPQVVAAFEKNWLKKPEIKKVIPMLATANDDASEKLVIRVLEDNPDHKVQAAACKALVDGYKSLATQAERVKENAQLRKQYEQQAGKEYVERLLAQADKAPQQSDKYSKVLKDKYADVFPDLSVGKKAPEVVSADLDGKKVKLSDLRGKVVVLDIWATWCPPCRAMIPHEREMVANLKDKPFVLVSISADEEKKTLTDFLKENKMPWTHWWNGARGGILQDWDVKYFPTIYVLDSRGIIRYKDVRGKQLEEAVEKLLKETVKE